MFIRYNHFKLNHPKKYKYKLAQHPNLDKHISYYNPIHQIYSKVKIAPCEPSYPALPEAQKKEKKRLVLVLPLPNLMWSGDHHYYFSRNHSGIFACFWSCLYSHDPKPKPKKKEKRKISKGLHFDLNCCWLCVSPSSSFHMPKSYTPSSTSASVLKMKEKSTHRKGSSFNSTLKQHYHLLCTDPKTGTSPIPLPRLPQFQCSLIRPCLAVTYSAVYTIFYKGCHLFLWDPNHITEGHDGIESACSNRVENYEILLEFQPFPSHLFFFFSTFLGIINIIHYYCSSLSSLSGLNSIHLSVLFIHFFKPHFDLLVHRLFILTRYKQSHYCFFSLFFFPHHPEPICLKFNKYNNSPKNGFHCLHTSPPHFCNIPDVPKKNSLLDSHFLCNYTPDIKIGFHENINTFFIKLSIRFSHKNSVRFVDEFPVDSRGKSRESTGYQERKFTTAPTLSTVCLFLYKWGNQ
ncbi:hypothetical protein VP01_39g1 [Puccinia sorghi]|uniref:Uncharacterized protein n=1 Tax=Puccinia sorghi TaxID=27349 RepID=A0A0L6USW8_9BASI|nr:hypothetical protein VP01_39g1 [Puccinia sorghi]